MELEDEADGRRSVLRRVVQMAQIRSADRDRALVGQVERADEVQQRALATAGRADDGRELTLLDAK